MPGTSIELTRGIRPYLETTPYDGFKPTTPQYDAGFLVEPPVSDPMALEKNAILLVIEVSKR